MSSPDPSGLGRVQADASSPLLSLPWPPSPMPPSPHPPCPPPLLNLRGRHPSSSSLGPPLITLPWPRPADPRALQPLLLGDPAHDRGAAAPRADRLVCASQGEDRDGRSPRRDRARLASHRYQGEPSRPNRSPLLDPLRSPLAAASLCSALSARPSPLHSPALPCSALLSPSEGLRLTSEDPDSILLHAPLALPSHSFHLPRPSPLLCSPSWLCFASRHVAGPRLRRAPGRRALRAAACEAHAHREVVGAARDARGLPGQHARGHTQHVLGLARAGLRDRSRGRGGQVRLRHRQPPATLAWLATEQLVRHPLTGSAHRAARGARDGLYVRQGCLLCRHEVWLCPPLCSTPLPSALLLAFPLCSQERFRLTSEDLDSILLHAPLALPSLSFHLPRPSPLLCSPSWLCFASRHVAAPSRPTIASPRAPSRTE